MTPHQMREFKDSDGFKEVVLPAIERAIEREIREFRSDRIEGRMWAVEALAKLKSELEVKKRVDESENPQ